MGEEGRVRGGWRWDVGKALGDRCSHMTVSELLGWQLHLATRSQRRAVAVQQSTARVMGSMASGASPPPAIIRPRSKHPL